MFRSWCQNAAAGKPPLCGCQCGCFSLFFFFYSNMIVIWKTCSKMALREGKNNSNTTVLIIAMQYELLFSPHCRKKCMKLMVSCWFLTTTKKKKKKRTFSSLESSDCDLVSGFHHWSGFTDKPPTVLSPMSHSLHQQKVCPIVMEVDLSTSSAAVMNLPTALSGLPVWVGLIVEHASSCFTWQTPK